MCCFLLGIQGIAFLVRGSSFGGGLLVLVVDYSCVCVRNRLHLQTAMDWPLDSDSTSYFLQINLMLDSHSKMPVSLTNQCYNLCGLKKPHQITPSPPITFK